MTLQTFVETHYGRTPVARACCAEDAMEVCKWSDLTRMLQQPQRDVLMVSRGAATDDPAPRSEAELREQFGRGVGLVLRRPERHDLAIADLCRALSRELPGEQRVLVFATPAGVHGFGWHYDPEEVFVLQTAGEKTYYLRQNTVAPVASFGAQPDFSVFTRERSPLMSCTLRAGNLLYIPRGYWHVAKPLSDSLSLSIGIHSRAAV